MEVLSNTQRNFKFFAGILGILQSLTWIVLSIIYLVIHDQDPSLTIFNYDSYMGEVQYYIYMLYVIKVPIFEIRDAVLTTHSFIVVVCIYLVLNLAWVSVSLNIIFRQNNKVSVSLKLWSLVTCSICLCDFIVVVILGTDYQKCLDEASGLEALDRLNVDTLCANGIISILMIAAKGFVLWLINFGLMIVLLKMSKNLEKQQRVNFLLPPTPYVVQVADPQTIYPQINSPQPHRHSLPVNPYYRQNSQPPTSPIYPTPTPRSPAVASRRWNVHSGSPRSSPASSHRTNLSGNRPMTPTTPNWSSRRQVVSNQTHQPFVLSTPPRRH